MHLRAWSIVIALLLPLPTLAETRPDSATTRPVQFTDASMMARGIGTVARLHTLRSVAELYVLQHRDKALTFGEVADWAIFLQPTDESGRLNPPAGTDPILGPYLPELPTNALTGHSRLCEAGKVAADAGWIWDARGKGPAILIALPDQSEPVADYLVACNLAVKCPEIHVEPQSLNIGKAAGSGLFAAGHPDLMMALNAKLRLQIARAQLAVAVPQRYSFYPTLDQMRDWYVLLASPGEGPVTPGEPVHPSLPAPLGNPFRNNATRIVAPGAAFPENPDVGWTYSAETGQLRIVVPADFTPTQALGSDDIEYLQTDGSDPAPGQSFP